MTTGPRPPGLRERTRRAVHREIAQAAAELFLAQGFDATTVDQIAAAAGVSRRSFFRYFATKEDVVLGDLIDRGHVLQAALARRPDDEDPWDSVAEAFLALRQTVGDPGTEEIALGRLLHEEPALRAKRLEKQLAWHELLVPELARRFETDGVEETTARHRAGAIIATALACLDVAVDTWFRGDTTADLEDLWRDALATVRGQHT